MTDRTTFPGNPGAATKNAAQAPSSRTPPTADEGLDRLALAGLLAATALSGLFFAPVFGLQKLLSPVLVVLLAAYLCAEACDRRRSLAPWRPVLLLAAGLLWLIESMLFDTTRWGLPTGESLAALWRGVTDAWLLTLQSTWPARPDPDQVLFVPLAVLLAAMLGVELLLRLRKPLLAVLPNLAVLALAQAYEALTGMTAVIAGLAYAGAVALLVWAGQPNRRGGSRTGPRRAAWRMSGANVGFALGAVIAILAGAVAVGGFDPVDRDPYSLKDGHIAPVRENRVGNPLQEIAKRLDAPDNEVFRYRAAQPVDRWTLITLDGFDGANWSTDARLRRLGNPLSEREGGRSMSAEVRMSGLAGPWLPSQPEPLGVEDLAPLVDQDAGTLLLDEPANPGRAPRYRLTWSEPDVSPEELREAPVDTAKVGSGDLGAVPPEVGKVAVEAMAGLRPTFQAAVQLQRYLDTNYQVAVGDDLPTGHSWPQLRQFLIETKRGTSEQFAAAYVALARINGIPARLAVGYRGSTETEGGFNIVRNRDVQAWPEVAVDNVGWVPLDVTAAASNSSGSGAEPTGGLARAAAQARDELPPENELSPAELPPSPEDGAGADRAGSPWLPAAIVGIAVIVGVAVLWLAGVPLARAVRSWRRQRRTGAEGVEAAWAEACDRLRGHGVPYRIGMTPRDLADAAGVTIGDRTRQSVIRLGRVLDMALWSGAPVGRGQVSRSWDEVFAVRGSLAGRPRSARLRAALDPRTLFPPAGRRRRSGD